MQATSMQSDLGQSATASPVPSLTPGSPSQASKKRKSTSAGSRGVATLTPDQLAKKRANDREAQRAIRERTKNTIESLERRIRDLESQQPYQELQVVIRQKEAVQAENDEIRRRLSNVLAIIQPVVGAQGLTGETIPALQVQRLTWQDLASAAHHNVQAGLAQPNNAFQQEPYLNGQRSYSDPQGQTSSYAYAQDAPSNDNRAWHTSRVALDQQRESLQRGLELNDSGERVSFSFLLDSLGQRAGHLSQPQQSPQLSPTSRSNYPNITTSYASNEPIWSQLPKNIEPTCPLDSILLNFYHARRRDASNSPSEPPAYPSVSSLLNPSSAQRIDPLSQLMTDIISKFPNIAALPEQAATLLLMFNTMRWMISPTEENYSRIPDFLVPTQTQLQYPHPAWIDHIPWPRMRDKLVTNYQDYPFENWFIPFTSGLSVNWPYDATDCLLSTSEKEDPILNPVFERHIRRLENWSVAPILVETFPPLADACRVKVPED